MDLFHSKDIVQPEFLLSSFHNKAVAVQKKDHGKNRHHHKSYCQKRTHCISASYVQRIRTCQKEQHDIQKGNTSDIGEYIRKICLPVIFDICHSQLKKQSSTHKSHRLSSE